MSQNKTDDINNEYILDEIRQKIKRIYKKISKSYISKVVFKNKTNSISKSINKLNGFSSKKEQIKTSHDKYLGEYSPQIDNVLRNRYYKNKFYKKVEKIGLFKSDETNSPHIAKSNFSNFKSDSNQIKFNKCINKGPNKNAENYTPNKSSIEKNYSISNSKLSTNVKINNIFSNSSMKNELYGVNSFINSKNENYSHINKYFNFNDLSTHKIIMFNENDTNRSNPFQNGISGMKKNNSSIKNKNNFSTISTCERKKIGSKDKGFLFGENFLNLLNKNSDNLNLSKNYLLTNNSNTDNSTHLNTINTCSFTSPKLNNLGNGKNNSINNNFFNSSSSRINIERSKSKNVQKLNFGNLMCKTETSEKNIDSQRDSSSKNNKKLNLFNLKSEKRKESVLGSKVSHLVDNPNKKINFLNSNFVNDEEKIFSFKKGHQGNTITSQDSEEKNKLYNNIIKKSLNKKNKINLNIFEDKNIINSENKNLMYNHKKSKNEAKNGFMKNSKDIKAVAGNIPSINNLIKENLLNNKKNESNQWNKIKDFKNYESNNFNTHYKENKLQLMMKSDKFEEYPKNKTPNKNIFQLDGRTSNYMKYRRSEGNPKRIDKLKKESHFKTDVENIENIEKPFNFNDDSSLENIPKKDMYLKTEVNNVETINADNFEKEEMEEAREKLLMRKSLNLMQNTKFKKERGLSLFDSGIKNDYQKFKEFIGKNESSVKKYPVQTVINTNASVISIDLGDNLFSQVDNDPKGNSLGKDDSNKFDVFEENIISNKKNGIKNNSLKISDNPFMRNDNINNRKYRTLDLDLSVENIKNNLKKNLIEKVIDTNKYFKTEEILDEDLKKENLRVDSIFSEHRIYSFRKNENKFASMSEVQKSCFDDINEISKNIDYDLFSDNNNFMNFIELEKEKQTEKKQFDNIIYINEFGIHIDNIGNNNYNENSTKKIIVNLNTENKTPDFNFKSIHNNKTENNKIYILDSNKKNSNEKEGKFTKDTGLRSENLYTLINKSPQLTSEQKEKFELTDRLNEIGEKYQVLKNFDPNKDYNYDCNNLSDYKDFPIKDYNILFNLLNTNLKQVNEIIKNEETQLIKITNEEIRISSEKKEKTQKSSDNISNIINSLDNKSSGLFQNDIRKTLNFEDSHLFSKYNMDKIEFNLTKNIGDKKFYNDRSRLFSDSLSLNYNEISANCMNINNNLDRTEADRFANLIKDNFEIKIHNSNYHEIMSNAQNFVDNKTKHQNMENNKLSMNNLNNILNEEYDSIDENKNNNILLENELADSREFMINNIIDNHIKQKTAMSSDKIFGKVGEQRNVIKLKKNESEDFFHKKFLQKIKYPSQGLIEGYDTARNNQTLRNLDEIVRNENLNEGKSSNLNDLGESKMLNSTQNNRISESLINYPTKRTRAEECNVSITENLLNFNRDYKDFNFNLQSSKDFSVTNIKINDPFFLKNNLNEEDFNSDKLDLTECQFDFPGNGNKIELENKASNLLTGSNENLTTIPKERKINIHLSEELNKQDSIKKFMKETKDNKCLIF